MLLIPMIAAIGLMFSTLRMDRRSDIPEAPLILLTSVSFLTLVNSVTIVFPQLQVTFFLLGVYAWMGLQVSMRARWQKMLNIAILLALAIPFYLEFHSGLGFGLRLATAYLVEQTLHGLGIFAVSSHDVIITENAMAHIDVPCSGLKSLWVGSAFYLAALVILGIRISWGVLLKYLVFMTLLLLANTSRILTLTLFASVYGMPEVAQMLHLPLGILGFTLSCLVGWFLLRHHTGDNQTLSEPQLVKPGKWVIGLSALLLLQLLIAVSQKNSVEALPISSPLPPVLNAQRLTLTPEEKQYFSRGKQTTAEKWQFHYRGIEGSMLIVRSRDFNMFHAPELCMAAAGITVDAMQTIHDGQISFRSMSLNKGSASGLYWLQSGDLTTDDFVSRYWYYIIKHRRQWSMISLVLQTAYPPENRVAEDLIEQMYTNLKEKQQ